MESRLQSIEATQAETLEQIRNISFQIKELLLAGNSQSQIPNASCKSIDEAVFALMSILECMADCKLESGSLTEKIKDSTIDLEKRDRYKSISKSLSIDKATGFLEGVGVD
ncbi:hypothetical protein Tsubulata_047172 [Turnera subulata]|uniref:Uncharacterized protein n=1 Tax=Turnera subulata TaxID=218843 RepID=A0A9Q0J8A7_9ROSI|nr:hypothetical protein Tsubulata_037717 [Turnera subulata]KAJ4847331.1 hypothetical protein Tsubulata_047172 [Turnera subulata]